jgi:hypothetical protein
VDNPQLEALTPMKLDGITVRKCHNVWLVGRAVPIAEENGVRYALSRLTQWLKEFLERFSCFSIGQKV